MKVGSLSPKVSQNLTSFESKSQVTSQPKTALEPKLQTFGRDGFEVRGGGRRPLRPQGDGFQPSSLKPSLLQTLPGKTPISQLSNLVKSGQLQAGPLPTALEPYKGITQKAIDDTSLDTLGRLRKNISEAVKLLGLKGKEAKAAIDQVLCGSIIGKVGGIGTQWAPGD